MVRNPTTRRRFNSIVAKTTVATLPIGSQLMASLANAQEPRSKSKPVWEPRYMLASCMYGYEKLEKILPEVPKTGATAIDIWPKVHGNQREQLAEMGREKFAGLMETNKIKLGCITQYPLGPFRLKKEVELASQLGCKTIVTAAKGRAGLKGAELKTELKKFLEKLKPHVEFAAKNDVVIAIENHAKSLLESPESMRVFAELNKSDHLGIAFAPYHLPQKEDVIADLIKDCAASIEVFYAWQHGKGCMKKMPKEDELLQMPGRGDLNFEPIVQTLAKINYQGWTEIFMHPFPRGIPILETVSEVTDEINRARKVLAKVLSG